ncbi:MAG: nuclear transport factor 2 family protein [Opitutaceae bacterium]|jgi:ketosteroid isomerase-like protein|nr:nuclear transport factor 2 family protein [Opitutaceae bacterium]
MKRFGLLLAVASLCLASAMGRDVSPAEQELVVFQQKIDDAVVSADVVWLQGAYTDDFYFKHGTGHVDSKASWLANVKKSQGGFLSRTHLDVEVDLHGDIGITRGKLRVMRKEQSYLIDYVRVYVRRDGRWQLLSHRTVPSAPAA